MNISADARDFRVVVIGAGFGGLGMATRLTKAGVDDFVVLERAHELGGTWRENTYPGCRCDVASHLYSYSLELNPDWSSTFSGQAEIWDYMKRVARHHGAYPHIRFGHDVSGASWDEDARCWRIDTNHGGFTAQVLIAALGPLFEPSVPRPEGVERFTGASWHSSTSASRSAPTATARTSVTRASTKRPSSTPRFCDRAVGITITRGGARCSPLASRRATA